jgi:hypothetical protein
LKSCKVDQDSGCLFIDDFDRTFMNFFMFPLLFIL